MRPHVGWLTIVSLLVALLLSPMAQGAESVTFRKYVAQPGDVSNQSLACHLDLEMSIQQSGQVVQAQKHQLDRTQQRRLAILQSRAGGPFQADVEYQDSAIEIHAADQPAQKVSQPVRGKTYRVTRQQDQLTITYPDGKTPPADELEIVNENMASFGRPNPIAEFFHGKQVRIGDTLKLPAELAQELLGYAQSADNVSSFELTLQEIIPARTTATTSSSSDKTGKPSASAQLARFAIKMVADDPQQPGIEMELTGQLEMEVATCRSRTVQLVGPVASEETHGPEEGQFQVRTEGQIEVAVKADYSRR